MASPPVDDYTAPTAPTARATPMRLPTSLRELFASRLDAIAIYGLVVAALTAIATTIGSALSPYLVVSHPLWLVLLSPIPRHMVVVAPSLDLPVYMIAGVLRRTLATTAGLCLGLRFGEAGIAWAETRDPRLHRTTLALRWAFRRGGLLVVWISPNPFVVASAVALGAPTRSVLAAAIAGHITWLWIWYQFGDLARAWITPITEFFRQYTWESTAVCVVVVALYYARRFMRR